MFSMMFNKVDACLKILCKKKMTRKRLAYVGWQFLKLQVIQLLDLN